MNGVSTSQAIFKRNVKWLARYIQIKGRGVLVRTGGGYMYLSEFMLHYAKSECLKIGLLRMKQKKSF